MGSLLIVLGIIWFVMALVFTFALAAAGARLCSNLESQASPFGRQISSRVGHSQTPPLLFGAQDAVQGA